jgi:uncharacterized circularly permuted ATP-grasp superfamily protein
MAIRWKDYPNAGLYDEVIGGSSRARRVTRPLARHLSGLRDDELASIQDSAALSILEQGITFRVYTEEEGSIDRAWPLDVIPRIMAASEWRRVERGLMQRVTALNRFIDDVYHDQRIIADGVFPAQLLSKSKNFLPECVGVSPPHGVWAHVCGTDLVRDGHGELYVLEDNLRVPSGVSYVLENRQVIKRVLPDLFEDYGVLPVDDYPSQLYDTLAALSPRPAEQPEIVVLTPGVYNSAYFEHSYLAQQMGCELVEGSDLVVEEDNCVYMRTIEGLARVDVVYRRIDDHFMDPEVFNKESLLGVPGLMRAWKAGTVALANAPGSGVADDKVVYAFVPEMIRYYLDEDALLPNVPTYLCMDPQQREFVLDNLELLVVKPANESGGYGMLMGASASRREREAFKKLIIRDPRNFIAQPTLSLSTVPTVVGPGLIEPRHVDLRPFILSSDRMHVTTGGLTRVAMRKGSLVVNSSQGGGSKDTWIVEDQD